jgi:RimJ/RimL family protein N-acetyltransferase
MELKASAAAEMFAVVSDPCSYEFISKKAPGSPLELEERYRHQEKRISPDGSELWLNWIVREVKSNVAMGFVQASAKKDDPKAQIGYLFHPQFWGKGYAFEALSQMCRLLSLNHKITFVWASIDPRNERSIKLMERLGFARSSIEPSEPGDIVMERRLLL